MSYPSRQTVNTAPYSSIPAPANRGKGIDIREELRKDIYKQNGGEMSYNPSSSSISLTAATVPGAGINTTLIYFDSSRKISSDRVNGTISFSIPSINNNNPISNCVSIRILPFYFPRMTPPTTQPDIWFYKRAYIRIISTGIAVNAVQASGNSQHHFELEVGDKTGLNNIAVDMEPIDVNGEGGVFRFMTPQTSITDIGFQFLRPLFTSSSKSLTPIQFPTDTLSVSGVGINYTIGSPGVTTREIFSLPSTVVFPYVPPAPGLAVFFTDTSNSLAASPDGWFVTQIGSNTTFQVAGLAAAGAVNATMLVGANRIAFRIEFICVSATPTNFTSLTQM